MRLSIGRRFPSPAACRRAAIAAVLGLLAPGDAAAQERERSGDIILDALGAPGTADYNVSAARRTRGFALFAFADAAGVGMRGTGNLSYALDNYSPCDAPLSGFCSWNVRAVRGAVTFQFFEILFAAGVPASEWARAREVVPSLRNARGGGYSYLTNFGLFRGRSEWGPRDGSLGRLFSGVTAFGDASCRDNSGFANGYFPPGPSMLAASDCPVTWPGGVWGGDRAVTADGWKGLFDARGDAFRWDYWRVADSLKHQRPFLGTHFSTYGETSDHYAEIRALYGAALPGGVGEPAIQGWPLGLVWRFEAFSFAIPALASVVFYRATVINRSADVYGVGLDYSSLYLGFQPGTGGTTGAGGNRFSNYYIPGISTALYHQSHVTAGGPCSETARRPGGVSPCSSIAGMGMNNGGNAFVVLKSPIGDLRNKLFTRTSAGTPCIEGVDPFCNPNHRLKGDTITFNHGHMCGFGSCWATTYNVNDKRSFGMLSSREAIVLDGRDPASLTNGEAWLTFRSAGFPAERGVFNKYVPGRQGPPAAVWDYTANGTGRPDTLYYDSCHVNGCVVSSSDTMPGGQLNAYGNVGGIIAAGPFPLAAGDSTSWFVAFVGEADSIRTWAAIDAATDMYLNLFLTPDPPPVPRIVATRLTSGTEGGGNAAPEVQLIFTDDPETWVDPYLAKLADDIDAAPAGSSLDLLRAANPELAGAIRARARDNFERLEIYKSCDGGVTFTGDADCVGDPTRDATGLPTDLGWVAYAVHEHTSGIPNSFTDRNVVAGRNYLYVLVTRSRGATFSIVDPYTGGPAQYEVAPAVRSTLASSGSPHVARVYVPVSRPAGYRPARIDYTETGRATVPLAVEATETARGGDYAIRFGNRITVERDSSISGRVGIGTRVVVARVVNAAPSGAPTVIRADTSYRDGPTVVHVAGAPTSTSQVTVGDTVRTTGVYQALGFVLTAGATPIFASRTLTGRDATPPGAFGIAHFPGFTVTADNALAGNFSQGTEQAFRGVLTRRTQRVPDTAVTVPRAHVNRFMAQWREPNSTRMTFGVGRYVLAWADDAFGLPRGLSSLGPGTAAELRAALAARAVAARGRTDADAARLLDAVLPWPVTQRDLVAVTLPFTVRNTTFGRDVSVAMLRRTLTQPATVANTYRLGVGPDTSRVRIPEDVWVPGDVLYFIEPVTRDSTVAGNTALDPTGRPWRVTSDLVTFTAAVVGCDVPNPPYCNPLGPGVPGSTGWLSTTAGDSAQFEYLVGFDPDDRWVFTLTAPLHATRITEVTDSAMARIKVVPNPFVIRSEYQTSATDGRLLWTNLPPRGTLRIYTISGQFVQQIRWTPADLTATGDLVWNLRSREEVEIASGLYVWVVTAPSEPANAASRPVTARGKFVVIRGRPL